MIMMIAPTDTGNTTYRRGRGLAGTWFVTLVEQLSRVVSRISVGELNVQLAVKTQQNQD